MTPRKTAAPLKILVVKHLAGDNSAAFRLEWPHLARHTPAASKRKYLTSVINKYVSVQVPRKDESGHGSP
jgi:hypothetical protein